MCSRCWTLQARIDALSNATDIEAAYREGAEKMLQIVRKHEGVIRGEGNVDGVLLEHYFYLLSCINGIKHLARNMRHTENGFLTSTFGTDQLRVIYEWVTDLTFEKQWDEWCEDAVQRYLRRSNAQ